MLEEYIEKQPIITKLLLNSYDNNKIVQAYLFVSEDKIFLMDYSLAFAKKIISNNDQKINNMIDNNNYPELKIINPINNNIKKEEMITLQKEFFVKPTIGNKLVYIVNGADKLNPASANTILKFLEEPSDDIVAILLTDNLAKVLPTIKSRCQTLILNNNKNSKISLNDLYPSYIFNRNIEEFTFDEFNSLVSNSINFIKQIEKLNINMFNHFKSDIFDIFKTKDDLNILFDFMLYFYYDILNLKLKRNIVYFYDNINELEDISNINNIESIQNKLSLIEETKIKLNSNMNIKLLMDYYLIKFSEV